MAGAGLLESEQLLFGLQAPSIARELAVRADRAMAWDQDRHRIRSVGVSNGTRCRRASDARRDLAIAARGACGNCAQLTPYAELKRSPADVQRHFASRGLAAQIAQHGLCGRPHRSVVADDFRLAEVAAQFALLPLVGLMHRKRADTARGHRDQHPAERRIDDSEADFRAASSRPPGGGIYGGSQGLVHEGFPFFSLLSISIAQKSFTPGHAVS